MSNESTFKDPIQEQIEITAALEKKKREVLDKELTVRDRNVTDKLKKIEENDRNTAISKETNYGMMTPSEVRQAQRENAEYMLAARDKKIFINEHFNDAVPFFRKNIILVGAKTGEGKSTAVANIIAKMARQDDENTKIPCKTLVITNEEKVEDVYNRITCLFHKWHYVAHNKFTQEQLVIFTKYIDELSKRITVIDDSHNGAGGTTTTIEGISQVFDDLSKREEYYDVVIIDYYQNISESRDNPAATDWEVQQRFARRLDKFKNNYPAPIVIMAQLKPGDDDSNSFKNRIEGRKSILNVTTCALEIVANKEDHTTEWIIQKSRFNEGVGRKITTGYDNGRFVLYNDDFKIAVERAKAAREQEAVNKTIKMTAPKENEDGK